MWELALAKGIVLYVDDRGELPIDAWAYQESNGVHVDRGAGIFADDDVTRHNLQRGASSPWLPREGDLCIDDPEVLPDVPLL